MVGAVVEILYIAGRQEFDCVRNQLGKKEKIIKN